jgi:hypothetical protein
MKYLITESKLEKVIFRYLDNQDFIQIEKNGSIYFINSEGDKYAQIKSSITSEWCYISTKLIDEISSLFSLHYLDSKEVIGSWVSDTLQIEVSYTLPTERLRAPN